MAEAQLHQQKRIKEYLDKLKAELGEGSTGLAWLYQQPTYPGTGGTPTTEAPKYKTTSEDARLVYNNVLDAFAGTQASPEEKLFAAMCLSKTLLEIDRLVKQNLWDFNFIDFVWQAEKGKTGKFHIHCLVRYKGEEDAATITKSLTWLLKRLNVNISKEYALYQAKLQNITDTPTLVKMKKAWIDKEVLKPYKYFNKKTRAMYNKQVNLFDYVIFYLFNKRMITKKMKEGYFAAGNAGLIDILSEEDRLLIHKMAQAEQTQDLSDVFEEDDEDLTEVDGNEEPDPVTEKPPTVTNQKAEASTADFSLVQKSCKPSKVTKPYTKQQEPVKVSSARNLLTDLIDNGIFTVEDWINHNPDTYLTNSLENNGQQKIHNLLYMAQVMCSSQLTPLDCILRFNKPEDHLPLLSLLRAMGLHNSRFRAAIATILSKQGKKINGIWFHGPAGTGKTLLAALIARAAKNYGQVTTSNPNFPWTDCGNRNIIWMEEAGNLGSFMEDFKAITGGGEIKVDCKNKQPQVIKGTTIITSNHDITRAVVGCTETIMHRPALEQRLLKVSCCNRVRPSQTITTGMLASWLRGWNGQTVPLTHKMHIYSKYTNQTFNT